MARHKTPMYLMLPPEEKDRLAEFSTKVGRAMSWVIRDALRVYLDAAEADADLMARLRTQLDAVRPDPSNIGQTPAEERQPPPPAYVR